MKNCCIHLQYWDYWPHCSLSAPRKLPVTLVRPTYLNHDMKHMHGLFANHRLLTHYQKQKISHFRSFTCYIYVDSMQDHLAASSHSSADGGGEIGSNLRSSIITYATRIRVEQLQGKRYSWYVNELTTTLSSRHQLRLVYDKKSYICC